MSTQVQEDNHAKNQAKAQLESIVEMVAALTRKGAAEHYVAELSEGQVRALLTTDVDSPDEDTSIEDLREQLTQWIVDESLEPQDFEFDEEDARQTIEEDPLSIEVRSGWYTLGSEDNEPAEFCILLCTGGPAVRIVGDLDNGQPSRPRIQYQDWGTPWTEYFHDQHGALQIYCEQFYFGD